MAKHEEAKEKKDRAPEELTEETDTLPEEAEPVDTPGDETAAPEETDPLAEATAKCEEYLDAWRRSMAEFDNYKKRTQKEKESTYSLATAEAVGVFLPLLDNLSRAYDAAAAPDASPEDLKNGMEGILKQAEEILKKLGVAPIEAEGKPFDPNLHYAVSHVDSEELGENTVAAEFQKGYTLGERVIRHSMVQVAN